MSKYLPDFIDSLKASWKLFWSKLKPLFLLSLAETAFISGGSAIIILLTTLLSLDNLSKLFSSNFSATKVLPTLASSLPQLSFFFVMTLLVVGVVSAIFSAAKIYCLSTDKSYSELFTFGKSKISRIFTSQLYIGLLGFGGFWLFGIPGLLIFFLTSFTIYELVFTNDSVVAALKRSVAIVWYNFWPLLGRYVLILLIIGILRVLFSSNGDHGQVISSLSWIINTLSGWFLLSYSYLLYKHVLGKTPKNIKVNLVWIVIPAVVGWLAFFSLFYFGTKFLQSRGAFDQFWPKIEQMIQDNNDFKMPDNLSSLGDNS
ncbi:MAG: hypothetical protein WCL07_04660 [bacterium]